ncbi:MAG: glycoside hydrolase family 26 protein [Acidimicrobiales bacterium]
MSTSRHVRVAIAALSVLATGVGAATIASRHARSVPSEAHHIGLHVASSPQSTQVALPRVPAAGGYLGVVPNPSAGKSTAEQIRPLEKAVARPFGIVSLYTGWAAHPPIAALGAAASTGAIPMVSMHCGPSDAAVAAGSYDGLLRADAEAYRAYGRPVLFRWFWEMNLTASGHNPSCLGTQSAGADFVKAWKHIWDIFHEVGAGNVAFVWAPSAARGVPSPVKFYPGSPYVNWIAADLLDRAGYGTFAQMFSPFYEKWVTQHKPMLVSETGAVGSAAQATWLNGIRATLPTEFPALRGVVYTDSVNNMGDYVLKPGTAGMAAFVALGRLPYLSEMGGE